MAPATDALRREHDAILGMIDVCEAVARRLDRKEQVPPATLEEILDFIRTFADRCHHGKEEDLLFPSLMKRGLPRDEGPIAVMLAEHRDGRELVRRMALAAEGHRAGRAGAGGEWAEAARGYAALLRGHIDKENNVLFPMAEQILPAEELADLARRFEEVEAEKIGPGTHEKFHRLLERLRKEYVAG